MTDKQLVSKCCSSSIEVVYGDGTGMICRKCGGEVGREGYCEYKPGSYASYKGAVNQTRVSRYELEKANRNIVTSQQEKSAKLWRMTEETSEISALRDFADRSIFLTPVRWSDRLKEYGKIFVLAISWMVFFLTIILLSALFNDADAQYKNPFTPRNVAVFSVGDEEAGMLHWREDLDTLREWQMETTHWVGRYNTCARAISVRYGEEYWPENPTLRNYAVDLDIVNKDYKAGKYPRLIDSINTHIKAGHDTEYQFADAAYQVHINYCWCRQTLGLGLCNADFIKRFPYRHVNHVIRSMR